MPIEAVEPLVSFITANIAWITAFVYVATILVKAAGYDETVFLGLSYMEILAVGVSGVFTYLVITPSTGLENFLANISWWVFGYAIVKPFLLTQIVD